MIGYCKPGLEGLIRHRYAAVAVASALSLLLGAYPGGAQEKDSGHAVTESQPSGSSQPPSDSAAAAAAAESPAKTSPEPESTQQTSATPPSAQPAPASANPEQAPAVAPGPRKVHKAQMRLSGSTCMSCLVSLERKLKSLAGIEKVKIERADAVHFDYQGAPGANYSEATISYDAGQVALADVVAFMKTQGYHAYKIVDKGKD